jgi:hypothetical protein
MSENKTVATTDSVKVFLDKIQDAQLRADCYAIVEMMGAASQQKPVMWGSAIVGFGSYHYVYESGREGDNLVIGFSPRSQNIAVYLKGGLAPLEGELAQLGKYKTGKGCLYIKKLGDVDPTVFKRILAKSCASAKPG